MNYSKLTIFLNILLSPFFSFLSSLFPKGNIVLLGTYSRHKYGENTKYLFEYLAKKEDIDAYWITDNKQIITHLKNSGFNHIGLRSPIKMFWILLRAKIIIDSGTGYFNPFGVLNTNKVTKISTLHGNGPKATVSRYIAAIDGGGIKEILNHHQFNYVNYPSNYSAIKVGRRNHLLPNEKIISLGYPRCDQYFDKDLVTQFYKNKKTAQSLCSDYKSNSKIILYTPTWRPYKFNFPLDQMDGMDLNTFDEWLDSNNIFFFFSVHTAHQPENIPKGLKKIIYIDPSSSPFFDINEFMMEVDILINDYSTTSTEFSLLNRPQLFFMPDYHHYNAEKGFVEDYRHLLPGKEIVNYNDLISSLNLIFKDEKGFIDKYNEKRTELLDKYYDLKTGDSAKLFYSFIKNILN